jgi:Do/DeqQ family serine protease
MSDPQNNLPPQDRSNVQDQNPPTTFRSAGRQGIKYMSLLLLSGVASCSFGYLAAKQQVSPSIVESPAVASPQLADSSKFLTGIDRNFITQVVDKVGPAVVRINSSTTVAARPSGGDEFDDPFFRRFFGDRMPQARSQDPEIRRGTGSGFIINNNGQILTNAHVVAGATNVTVTLKDGRTVKGKVKGIDRVTDVAIVEVAEKNLPSIQIGDSEKLKPGEWAIAIGNPLGLDNTVTAGIISATGRSSADIGSDKRVNYIQTDAAINPGNSGGPLLNSAGQAIGMNTAILRGAQGLGFAIPINTAQRIAKQLIATGKVDHPFLGVQMVNLTPELKEKINSDPNAKINIDTDKGALIGRVVAKSPAAKAGMRSGDIIQSINGKAVQTSSEVQQAMDTTQIGTNVRVQVRRNNQNITLDVKPIAAPPMAAEPE